jgi:hypothetical protein
VDANIEFKTKLNKEEGKEKRLKIRDTGENIHMIGLAVRFWSFLMNFRLSKGSAFLPPKIPPSPLFSLLSDVGLRQHQGLDGGDL